MGCGVEFMLHNVFCSAGQNLADDSSYGSQDASELAGCSRILVA